MNREAENAYKRFMISIEALKRENKTFNSAIRKNRLKILKILIKIIEEADPYTRGHSLKVYKYVVKMGRALNLKKGEIKRIGTAAILHDLGKIGIEKSVMWASS